MRGETTNQTVMLLAVTPDQLVPPGHPIRQITSLVERALAALSPTLGRCTPQLADRRSRRSIS